MPFLLTQIRGFGASVVLGFAAVGPVAAQEDGATAARTWLTQAIAADHADFADAAAALDDAVDAYCAETGERADAERAYHQAADAFMRVQWAGIGPAILFDRRYRVNFWPDESNAISRQLAAAVGEERADLLTPEGLAGTSAALQGLPALERLLFGQPLAEPGAYTCALATSIGHSVHTIADELAAAWQEPVDAMPGPTPDAFLATVMDALYGHITVVEERKLARIAGPTPSDARPRTAEARRSGRSLRNIAINLATVTDLLTIVSDDSLASLLDDADDPALANLPIVLATALDMADRLSDRTMAEALATPEGHAEVLALVAAIEDIRRLFARSVYPALGLTVGFNSTDGD